MILSRSYPQGTPIHVTIPCPEEIVRPTRDGRTLVVEATRPTSISRLRVLGFREVPPDAYTKNTPSPEESPVTVEPPKVEVPKKGGKKKKTEKTEPTQE